jgi:uncharacterized damage-inducible protein DinB
LRLETARGREEVKQDRAEGQEESEGPPHSRKHARAAFPDGALHGRGAAVGTRWIRLERRWFRSAGLTYPPLINDGALLIAARHNCWANLQLLEFCATLVTEQLASTAPGTYGTIHATLQHIIESERDYLSMMSSGEFTPELGRVAPLDELRTLARGSAEKIVRVFTDIDLDRALNLDDGVTVTARVIAAQLIHHGSDHRAHIGTILGSRGVQPPRLDAWAYGRAIGELEGPSLKASAR